MRLLIAAITLMAASTTMAAQADVAKCAFLPDKEFAACLAKELAATEAATEAAAEKAAAAAAQAAAKPKPAAKPKKELPKPINPGKWRVDRQTSKVDDSQNIFIYLPANDLVATEYRGPVRPVLWLRCMENRSDVILNLEDTFSFYSEHRVTTRVDKAKAQERTWTDSSDHAAVFHPNGIAFTRSLAEGDSLYVKTAPINEDPIEITFDLRGLRYYLPELQKACHWS